MRRQLIYIINSTQSLKKLVDEKELTEDFNDLKASDADLSKIRQIFVSCMPEQIARRAEGQQIPKGAYQTQRLEVTLLFWSIY